VQFVRPVADESSLENVAMITSADLPNNGDDFFARLARIELALEMILLRHTVKEWYTTDEVAEILGKAPFTVRAWCRNGRIHAEKRNWGRGSSKEWIVSHEELERIQAEGLLPPEDPPYRHPR
jgi:hypothetical protein